MTDLNMIGNAAKEAAGQLAMMPAATLDRILLAVANGLKADTDSILKANEKDLAIAKESGMSSGMQDRLRLTAERVESMAEGIRQVVEIPNPVGQVIESFDRPNGLHIDKVRVPMGVIGIIYESRPNVTADAFALCFKTANACILKGGSDAILSNIAIEASIRKTLRSCGAPEDAIQLIHDTDRAVTAALMKLNTYVDVLIPRGGAGLIRFVVENSTVPVIETGTGNCHIYVDETADLDKAIPIILNAKTQRVGVCNACESLVVHEKVAEQFLPVLAKALYEKSVEIRADEKSFGYIPAAVPATEEDFGREYLDYILSVKVVSDVDEAIRHVNKYHTGHSDAILTQTPEHAEKFLNQVDSACVYLNASTRFTDGFEFGFGAEIGISTQKLHARGPMGLKELTSYKYIIKGDGQTR